MKRDLYFSKPIMNAAGSLGFSPDPHSGIGLDAFGAFLTNPISLRPRGPAAQPRLLEFPGGILLHSGLPNPGLRAVLKVHAPRWRRADLPIIVHLMADRPEETQRIVRSLEGLENVMAVELGFAPLLSDDLIRLTLEMCAGEIPLIFSLHADRILHLGPRLVEHGAAAVSLSPPRGTLAGPDGKPVSGRLYGPSLLPHSLERIRSARLLGIPILGSGGIASVQDAAQMLAAGALGVQVDTRIWTLPRGGHWGEIKIAPQARGTIELGT